MLDAHAHVMQVKLCKANTRGVTPPPSPSPISRSEKSWIRDKRATSLPCAHTQVCARDNKSVTCLESYAMTDP